MENQSSDKRNGPQLVFCKYVVAVIYGIPRGNPAPPRRKTIDRVRVNIFFDLSHLRFTLQAPRRIIGLIGCLIEKSSGPLFGLIVMSH
jgi:hypothetical protein